MSIYHDEIEIEDFEYDEEEEVYYYPCPCGDRFEISKVRHILCIIHSVVSSHDVIANILLFFDRMI